VGLDEPLSVPAGSTAEPSAPSLASFSLWDGRLPAAAISPEITEWPEPEPSRYLIAGEYARGGRGRILEAYDRRLDRPVALKELLRDDSSSRARFAREALVTARLQHPAIVPVFDVGRWPSGKPFFSMKMMTSARSMAQVIDETRKLEGRLTLLPALVTVANAIAYAHQQGVLHRDLKPSNILLGPFGETVVIDWGLATDMAAALRPVRVESVYQLVALPLTQTGSVMGTPLYMAPEQSKGNRIDERADVYALGAILYHLLAGAPPYADAGPREIMQRLEREPPAPVEGSEPEVPQELVAIVGKALARDPADRYPSAQAFADELKRFQTGQLVRAYHYRRRTLIRRWLSRHKPPILVGMVFLAVFVAAGTVALRRLIQEHDVAQARSDDLILFQARSLLDRDPTAALAWLKSFQVLPHRESAVREIAFKAHSLGIARHVFRRDESWLSYVAFSPDSRSIATARRGRKLQVVDLESGAVIGELSHGNGLDGRIKKVSFASSGTEVLFSDWQNNLLYRWNFRTGELRSISTPGAEIVREVLSPDGKWMVAITSLAELWLWNVQTSKKKRLQGHRGRVNDVAFSAQADELISTSADGTARVWNLSSGAGRALQGSFSELKAVSVSNAGTIAAADAQGTIHIWDAASGAHLSSHPHGEELRGLAFSPDGDQLASGGESGKLRVLDISTGITSSFSGHQRAILAVAFASRQRVATGGLDGTVRIWDVKGGSHHVFRGHSAPVSQVAFSSDEKYLASSGEDGTARVWPVAGTNEEERVLVGHTDLTMHAAFSPDGQKLATAGRDRTVRIWDLKSGASAVLRGHTDLVYRTAFAADGKILASVGFDGVVRVWDIPSGTGRDLLHHQGTIWNVKFSHRGHTLASAGADGTVALWDLQSQTPARSRKDLKAVYTLDFSPDDRLLAFGGSDGFGVWNLETGEVSPFRPGEEATEVAFSPDGRKLAWAGNANWVRVLDIASGRIAQLAHPEGHLRTVAFSPDGRYLASGDDVNTVVLWDLDANRSRLLRGHDAQILTVAFSPVGALLASGSWDNTVRLWDPSTAALLGILLDNNHVLNFAFSPNGQTIAAVGGDEGVKLWPVRRGAGFSESAFFTDFTQWAHSETSAVFESDFVPHNP